MMTPLSPPPLHPHSYTSTAPPAIALAPTPVVRTEEEIGPVNTVTGHCCIRTVLYGRFSEPSTGLSNP